MSFEHMRKEAPSESTAWMARDWTPFAKMMDANEGEVEVLSTTPFAEGLQDAVNERSWYLMGPSSSLQLADEPEESFKAICNLVSMAFTVLSTPTLPMHCSEANESKTPLQIGGELTETDNAVSAKTLVEMCVTRQVNLTEVTSEKKAAFTIKLGDCRDVKVSPAERDFVDEVHSNL